MDIIKKAGTAGADEGCSNYFCTNHIQVFIVKGTTQSRSPSRKMHSLGS
jgi:hypothetical protein